MRTPTTPWFPPDVTPARVGVYQRDTEKVANWNGNVNFSYWDGKKWSYANSTPRAAYDFRGLPSARQDLPWRGLAADPAKGDARG